MDFGTVVGLLSGLFLIGSAIFSEGDAIMYWDPASVLITLGGTFAATLINYSIPQVLMIFKLLGVAFMKKELEPDEVTSLIVGFAEKARREGLLSLEEDANELDNEFLQKGIQLVVDGTDPQLVRNILETKINFVEERHSQGQEIFKTMGTMCPAFGMLGTLIGLIRMLGVIDDPSSIGGGLATALITTLYGSFFANLIFIPIAGKLQVKSEKEILLKEVIIEGVLSIQAGENPRIVEEKLNAFLPTRKSRKGKVEEDEDAGMAVEN